MRGAPLVIALVLAAIPAVAQELPRFNVEGHCKQVASFGGSYSASLDAAFRWSRRLTMV